MRTGVPGAAGRSSGRCRTIASSGLPSCRSLIRKPTCNSRNCSSRENGIAPRTRSRHLPRRRRRARTGVTVEGYAAVYRGSRPIAPGPPRSRRWRLRGGLGGRVGIVESPRITGPHSPGAPPGGAQGPRRRVAVKAPRCLRSLAEAASAKQVAVLVDPGACDAEVEGQLAGADEALLLPLGVSEELHDAAGDLLDGLGGEIDGDAVCDRAESSPSRRPGVACRARFVCGARGAGGEGVHGGAPVFQGCGVVSGAPGWARSFAMRGLV